MILDLITVETISHLWEIKVPSNIALFRWRVILNKLLPKDQLCIRGVIMNYLCAL